MTINDIDTAGHVPSSPTPDAHGQAALLLVESLIHELCANAMLTTGEAVDITERAISVQRETAEAGDEAKGPMWRSHALLLSIANSLKIDDDHTRAPPRLVT